MSNQWMVLALAAAVAAAAPLARAADRDAPESRRRLADAFVKGSDKYLHQDRLRRGMSGYGKTVMEGTKIERFNATVVSVLRNWCPHQDMILVRLSGLGLEKTGIISGMSGSPVYIKDEADGKTKMIGAVAYGWSFQNEPVAGVQPIAQMLAVHGVPLPGEEAPAPAAGPEEAAGLDERVVRAVLEPRKVDFASPRWPARAQPAGAPPADGPQLLPLSTPLMITGGGGGSLERARALFAGTHLLPVRAGTFGAADAPAAEKATLEPGSGISIPLATGDIDWAAVGTTTEVIGKHVLAFGHAFYSEGATRLPMGPAYVHTVISSSRSSFKLGSTARLTGALTADENTGIGGQLGQQAEMIPMHVAVRTGKDERKYSFNVVKHRWITRPLIGVLLAEAVLASRDLPQLHTVEYAVTMEFEKFGAYRAANRSSGEGLSDMSSDLARPLAALIDTPLGRPVFPRSVEVNVSIEAVDRNATILALELDRNVYRPGQRLSGRLTFRPFRQERKTMDVAMDLPDDLPDGQYTLAACDATSATGALTGEMPHRFNPRTVEQLFASVQEIVRPKLDRVYLRLPLNTGGLAVRKDELELLPGSMAEMLAKAAPIDSRTYHRAKVVALPAEHVMVGSATASFTVTKEPQRRNE